MLLLIKLITDRLYGSTRSMCPGSGFIWTGTEKVLVYGINFAQGIVLARLLGPEDFGHAAMLGLFLCAGSVLAESGLGTALVVKSPLISPPSLFGIERRAFRWNVGTAVLLYALLALLAFPVSAWYGKPILIPLMWAMAGGLVVNAMSVVATARLTRHQAFGRLAFANGLGSVFGAAGAIGLAVCGCGVWSIAGMGLVQAGVRTLLVCGLSCALISPMPEDDIPGRREQDDGGFRSVLLYGSKLMVSGLVHVVYAESYNLIIGKLVSPAAVGLFARGGRWAKLPGEIVNESVSRVALPVLARRQNRLGRFAFANCVLLWPSLMALGIWAPEVVRFLLGPHWLDCVPYLRILLVGQFFTPLSSLALQALRARGQANLLLKTDIWKKPIGFAALLVGFPFGVAGLCWAKVIDDLVEAFVDCLFCWRGRA